MSKSSSKLSSAANRLRRTSAPWGVVITSATDNGSKFFDEGAMRFFDSALHGVPVHTPGDSSRYYFVTSERYSDDEPRLYTVRVIDIATAEVEYVSKFQEFATVDAAIKAMRFVAGVA